MEPGLTSREARYLPNEAVYEMMKSTNNKKKTDGSNVDGHGKKTTDTSGTLTTTLKSAPRDKEGTAGPSGATRVSLRRAAKNEEEFPFRIQKYTEEYLDISAGTSASAKSIEKVAAEPTDVGQQDTSEMHLDDTAGTVPDIKFDTLEVRLQRVKAMTREERERIGWPPVGDSLESSYTSSVGVGRKKRRGDERGDSTWGEVTADEARHVLKLKRKRSDNLPSEAEIRSELRDQPTLDLIARARELQERVRYVADHSTNLTGTFIRDLRLCGKVTNAIMEEVHARMQPPTSIVQLRAENSKLIGQVLEQERTITQLKTLVEEMRKDIVKAAAEPRRLSLPGITDDAPPPLGGCQDIRVELQAMEHRILRRLTSLVEEKLDKPRDPLAKAKPRITSVVELPGTGTVRSKGVALSERALTFAETLKRGQRRKTRSEREGSMITSTPRESEAEDEQAGWNTVRGRRAKLPKSRTGPTTSVGGVTDVVERSVGRGDNKRGTAAKGKKGKPTPRVGRVPSSAAVALSLLPGAKTTLASVMATARAAINVGELGIGPGEIRPKRAITGGLLLEVLGEDQKVKADKLAERMRAALGEIPELKIAVPKKQGELRLTRIDESVRREEIAAAIALNGGCEEREVRVGEVRFSPFSLGTAWVSCPIGAAKKVAALDSMAVGWSSVMVTPLEARPLQCLNCMGFGHVKARCPAAPNQKPRCFRCGAEDHLVSTCPEVKPQCFLCKGKKYAADHRMGGKLCRALLDSRRIPPVRQAGDAKGGKGKKEDGGVFKAPKGTAPRAAPKTSEAGTASKAPVTPKVPPLSGNPSMEVET